jgi:L-ascorbate metabolism protein UlaG (beta-lactamase superfamily)
MKASAMTAGEVTIRWHGQACMEIVSPAATAVVVDPFDESIGLRLPDLEADVVITTHNHYDHANVAAVRGRPKVLHGVDADGRWATVSETVGDVRIRTVGAWHDELCGAKRGLTAIVIIETGGLVIVHCGDLGHVLSADHVRAIGPVDVLAVPVGGLYTVAAQEAREVVRQLAPRRAVIPIHYRVGPLALRLDPVDPFLEGWRHVRRLDTNEVRLAEGAAEPDPNGPEIIVLAWRSPDSPSRAERV